MWPFSKRTQTRKPEVNSGEQVEIPTRLRMSDKDDRIRQMIRHELFRQAAGQGDAESFEEADDFDLDDGEEWVSPYEDNFDPIPSPADLPAQAPAVVPAPSQQPTPEQNNVPPQPSQPGTP